MGTSKTVAELAKKIQKIQEVPAVAVKAAVRANATIAKTNAENEVRAATGGSSRLRNVGKSGANLSVASRIEKDGQRAFVKAVGPWQLIEYPTTTHYIDPAGQAKVAVFGPTLSGRTLKSKGGRSGAKARTGRAKALRTPFGLKAHVLVRGTKGKRPWAKALAKTEGEAGGVLQKVTHDELVKALS